MAFSEICIYQVRPDKVDEFEKLMERVTKRMEKSNGVQFLRFVKRTHNIREFAQIKQGLPPNKLTKAVKSVKYMLYWEFDTDKNYGLAQKSLYETDWKSMDKYLIVPHDKYLGERLF